MDLFMKPDVDHSPYAVAERLDRAMDLIGAQDRQIDKLIAMVKDNMAIMQTLMDRIEVLEERANHNGHKNQRAPTGLGRGRDVDE